MSISLDLFVNGAVITASLLGSTHCAAMCGGLVVATTEGRVVAQILYHLGRGVSYTLLGAIAGFASSRIYKLPSTDLPSIRILQFSTTALIAIYFLFLGVQKLRSPNASAKVPRWFSRIFEPLLNLVFRFRSWPGGSFLVGLATALLPCGWLYSFVLAAFLTQSAGLGALTMFSFWLGSVPILSAIGTGASLATRLFRSKAPRITGILFLALGILSIAIHARNLKFPPSSAVTPLNIKGSDESCH